MLQTFVQHIAQLLCAECGALCRDIVESVLLRCQTAVDGSEQIAGSIGFPLYPALCFRRIYHRDELLVSGLCNLECLDIRETDGLCCPFLQEDVFVRYGDVGATEDECFHGSHQQIETADAEKQKGGATQPSVRALYEVDGQNNKDDATDNEEQHSPGAVVDSGLVHDL